MFSKMKMRIPFLLLVVLSGLTACEKFLGKEQQKSETIVITPKELQCLQSWPEKVKSYVDDKADVQQTNGIFSCISDAMTAFAKFTKGQNADSYTPSELVHYLNRYMLKEYQIKESFMNELMKIKVFMIGGSATSISRTEIDQIKTHLQMLREEAQKLRTRSCKRPSSRITTWYIQRINATEVNLKNTSLGVKPPCLFLGRSFSKSSTRCTSSSVTLEKSVFFGKYLRMSPLRFSFDPRSYDAYAWAKYIRSDNSLSSGR